MLDSAFSILHRTPTFLLVPFPTLGTQLFSFLFHSTTHISTVPMLRYRWACRLGANSRQRSWWNNCAQELLLGFDTWRHGQFVWVCRFLAPRLPARALRSHQSGCNADRHRCPYDCNRSISRSHLCIHARENDSSNEIDSWNAPLAVATESRRADKSILVR